MINQHGISSSEVRFDQRIYLDEQRRTLEFRRRFGRRRAADLRFPVTTSVTLWPPVAPHISVGMICLIQVPLR